MWPRQFFLNIGTNDMNGPDYSLEGLLARYEAIVREILEKLPGVKITLLAYYPLCESRMREDPHMAEVLRYRNNRTIAQANQGVEALARRLGLSFANCNQYLVDSTGGLKEEYTIEGMHIYGDLACDEIWLQLSSGDDTREVLLTNIDFRGWQFREARLDQLTPGKSYRVSGIKVVRKGPFFSNSGSFYLDNMLAYTSSGIQTVATSASIQVYPNPATDLLHIQSEAPVQRVALYNLAGSCVATGTEAVLDVTGIPAGTYLLQIRAADHNFCYPVLIVH